MSNREDFVAKLKAQLDEWNIDLDKLQAKAEHLSAEVKSTYHEKIASLTSRRDEAKQKLAELEELGEEAWDKVEHTAEQTWTGIKDAFAKARAQFKGEEPPADKPGEKS